MNRKMFITSFVACSAASALSGCYVVPIDPRYPPEYGYQPVFTQPGQSVVAVPAPQPMPVALQGRLYPINDTAGRMGALTATASDTLNGHASFTINYGADPLRGEASRVPNDYPGFGNVHRQVYGEGRMPVAQRGIASAAGAQGTFVNCEYVLTAAARGTGVCVFSNGAKYQIHFGG
ncbi:MAG: hypothetical protein ACXWCH_01705 [Burkholderiales bacterium]